ncbi:10934_t:CDS:2 [Entrophospora sp. SA101]|nr:10934_t:CDS:2 [Entrophospora sp. SA101]
MQYKFLYQNKINNDIKLKSSGNPFEQFLKNLELPKFFKTNCPYEIFKQSLEKNSDKIPSIDFNIMKIKVNFYWDLDTVTEIKIPFGVSFRSFLNYLAENDYFNIPVDDLTLLMQTDLYDPHYDIIKANGVSDTTNAQLLEILLKNNKLKIINNEDSFNYYKCLINSGISITIFSKSYL